VDGILNIDKPASWTSFDVVSRVRGLLGVRRVGHTGTLDPMAKGVLVVCVGQATRISAFLEALQKEYLATLRLGLATDTLDASGRVVAETAVPRLSDDDIRRTLKLFQGEILQVPPVFSALKWRGERLYSRARRGETPLLSPRAVRIDEIELLGRDREEMEVRVACGKGTYIRALARDIGASLGCAAHLKALTRTRNGPYLLSEAIQLDDLQGHSPSEIADRFLQPMTETLGHLPSVRLEGEIAVQFAHGQQVGIPASSCPLGQPGQAVLVRVVTEEGKLAGVGEIRDSVLHARRVLRGPWAAP
jgi:tRNA pseudouridine55 synthase